MVFALSVARCEGAITARKLEPIVLKGSEFPAFNGIATNRIVLYTLGPGGSWIEIPYQVDERTIDTLENNLSANCQVPGIPCDLGYLLPDYSAPGVPTADDEAGLDGNDEIVFMARDATGSIASATLWLGAAGFDTRATRYQIAVRDPVGGEVGYVYAYAHFADPVHQPGVADYVSWSIADPLVESCLNPSPPNPQDLACGWLRSTDQGSQAALPRLNLYFSGNWTLAALCQKPFSTDATCTQANGAKNLVDETRWETTIPSETGWGWDQGCRSFLGYKDGPVRVIRRTQGAQSGRYTTKTEFFYGTWLDQRVNLRVHPIGSVAMLMDHRAIDPANPGVETPALVFTKAHSNANDNRAMDVVNLVPPATVVGSPQDWVQVDFSRGTYLQFVKEERAIRDAIPSFEYLDLGLPTADKEYQAGRYGQYGFKYSGSPCLPRLDDAACFVDNPENHLDLLYARFLRTLVPQTVDAPDGDGTYRSQEGQTYAAYLAAPLVGAVTEEGYTPNPPLPCTPPCTPTLSASVDEGGFSVSGNVGHSCACPPAGVNVYRGYSPGSYTLLSSLGHGSSFRDATVRRGTTYRYVARAYDRDGALGPFSQELVLTVTDTVPPPVPVGVVAVPGSGKVTLTWDPSASRDRHREYVNISTSSGGPFSRVNPDDPVFCDLVTYTVKGCRRE